MNKDTTLCPRWCDARCCKHEAGSENVDHRSTPMGWKSSCDDFWLSTSLARLDSIDPELGYVGNEYVRLELLDMQVSNPDGSEVRVGTDLTAADARLLAAALVCLAEQLEAASIDRSY